MLLYEKFEKMPLYAPAAIIVAIGLIGYVISFLLNGGLTGAVIVNSICLILVAIGMYMGIMPTGIIFRYDEHNKIHRWVRLAVVILISLYCFISVWYLIAHFVNLPVISTPVETWDALVYLFQHGDTTQPNNPSMWSYIWSSMLTFLKGFAIALIVAIPLGLLLGANKTLNDLCTPAIEVLRPIAPIAWAPILIIAMGAKIGPMFVVAIGIFFPLLTNTIFGVMKIDKNLIDASKTLGANKWQIFSKVMVPCSLPYVMNGMKIGLGIGWMCIIAAEIYAPQLCGIGSFLVNQATAGNWPFVYACLIMIAAMGLLTTGVAQYLHKFLTKRMGFE